MECPSSLSPPEPTPRSSFVVTSPSFCSPNGHSRGHSRAFSLNSNYSVLSQSTVLSGFSSSNSTNCTTSRLQCLRHDDHGMTPTTSLIAARLSRLSEIERILMNRDNANCGSLDLDSFQDAVTDLDPDCAFNDIEYIFKLIADSDHGSSHIAIAALIEYMDNALRRLDITSMDIQSATRTFHAAFPQLFADRKGLQKRIIWGNAQTSSLHKLLQELNEEAENEGVIDFPEFVSAIKNMGIKVDKEEMKKVFDHVLRLQNTEESQDEIEVSFLMRLLEQRIKRHSVHSKARILIQCSLMDLLHESYAEEY